MSGRRAAIGALMHPCRNARKPKSGAPFSLHGSAGKMSLPIHRGNSDELNHRPGITQANPLLQQTSAVERGCWAQDTCVEWMQGISSAIWMGSSSCPWLAADASLTAPSFQLRLLGFCCDQLGWSFVVLGFFQVEIISHFF